MGNITKNIPHLSQGGILERIKAYGGVLAGAEMAGYLERPG